MAKWGKCDYRQLQKLRDNMAKLQSADMDKFCRDMSKAVLFNGSIPYLAPEIALLYKSSQAEREEYHYDFEQTYPHMSSEQKEWFSQKLDILYPEGHKWRVNM